MPIASKKNMGHMGHFMGNPMSRKFATDLQGFGNLGGLKTT